MNLKQKEKARKKKVLLLLFFSLVILGTYFYNMSDRNILVLCSGIAVFVLYVCMAINRFFRKSFSQNVHKLFCVTIFIMGIVFLFNVISAIEKTK